MISEPPPGGRIAKTAYEHQQAEREHDRQLYWRAVDTLEFKRAMKHISDISDRTLQVWKIRLKLRGNQ